jgi:hypothetical protein
MRVVLELCRYGGSFGPLLYSREGCHSVSSVPRVVRPDGRGLQRRPIEVWKLCIRGRNSEVRCVLYIRITKSINRLSAVLSAPLGRTCIHTASARTLASPTYLATAPLPSACTSATMMRSWCSIGYAVTESGTKITFSSQRLFIPVIAMYVLFW